MKTTRISRGGQITVPAEIRKRWGTTNLLVEDHGDSLVLRPIPADPIGAAMGSFAGPGPTSDEMRAQERADEARIERRRLRALGR